MAEVNKHGLHICFSVRYHETYRASLKSALASGYWTRRRPSLCKCIGKAVPEVSVQKLAAILHGACVRPWVILSIVLRWDHNINNVLHLCSMNVFICWRKLICLKVKIHAVLKESTPPVSSLACHGGTAQGRSQDTICEGTLICTYIALYIKYPPFPPNTPNETRHLQIESFVLPEVRYTWLLYATYVSIPNISIIFRIIIDLLIIIS